MLFIFCYLSIEESDLEINTKKKRRESTRDFYLKNKEKIQEQEDELDYDLKDKEKKQEYQKDTKEKGKRVVL